MNTTFERGTDVLELETGFTPQPVTFLVNATVQGFGTAGDVITVNTPFRQEIVVAGNPAQVSSVLNVPTSVFTATGPGGNIPVQVFAGASITPPPETPHVRVILTNAIITAETDPPISPADDHLHVLATIEALRTGSATVTIVTPDGSTTVTMEKGRVDFVVFSVPVSIFTASDADGSLPVCLFSPGSTPPPPAKEVQIILTDLTLTFAESADSQ